ncbi:LysE family translocator [Geodermatophilus chilensis]|uniref:LysE family translocator n=1 Tax=Geodermatophilus chilensis TaxID=2035835 RepID=UPI000C269B80|nr:LysE family translocator [Geodermatophilus chilensis]
MGRDLAVFAAAFAVSAALPGPDTMLLFSRALSGGARAAGTVALGLTLGKLVLLTAAVAGVAAVAAALGPLFVVPKVAGGAYLFWLAVGLWRRAGATPTAAEETVGRSRLARVGTGWRGIGLGAALTVSNPQALLFYIAVLPAVLGGQRVGADEYLLLCAVLAAVMAAVAAVYITLATRVRAVLSASRRRVADRVGAVLLGLTGAVVIAR